MDDDGKGGSQSTPRTEWLKSVDCAIGNISGGRRQPIGVARASPDAEGAITTRGQNDALLRAGMIWLRAIAWCAAIVTH